MNRRTNSLTSIVGVVVSMLSLVAAVVAIAGRVSLPDAGFVTMGVIASAVVGASADLLVTIIRRIPRRSVHVFISYRFDDAGLAGELEAHLNRRGAVAWLADERLKVGDKIDESIRDAIASSDYVVVLLGRGQQSPWVLKEIEMADRVGVPVVPVITSEAGVAPTFAAIDLQRSGEAGIEELAARLVEKNVSLGLGVVR